MTIRIVTDSACDLPQHLVDQHGIGIVPLSFRFGDEEFIDRQSLTVSQFWDRCSSSPVLPETAAPSPGQFEAEFRRLASQGATGIVVVSLSSDLSATMQSAELAAKSLAGDISVRVVDSRSASMGQGITAVATAKVAASGASLEEVERAARDFASRARVWGVLDTLENLKKGGRIGGAKAFLATTLSIKPVIEIRNGKVEEGGRQRTRSKALAFLATKVREAGHVSNLAILQAQCTDFHDLVNDLKSTYRDEIVVGDIGPIIGSHAGSGTIGVAYHID
ncbi:MAG: DegV family protein [Actinobacteria bacterium]|jgi:DegV family protein with EDD domain|nr:DegV family protein [Actinomycetota bacterium]NDD86182.1 DegV family protein [Actinomycetota bacterium]NDI18211.1 DegV family protein [Actinomycetota bacterium]